jgi:hypothetical protein
MCTVTALVACFVLLAVISFVVGKMRGKAQFYGKPKEIPEDGSGMCAGIYFPIIIDRNHVALSEKRGGPYKIYMFFSKGVPQIPVVIKRASDNDMLVKLIVDIRGDRKWVLEGTDEYNESV